MPDRSFAASLASLLSLALAWTAAGTAQALDFDDLVHGEIANGFVDGVTITADNFDEAFDLAVGFDTRESGTRDADLEAALFSPYWAGGNIADEALDLILVIQENDLGCGDGVCDAPDDEGSRNGGLGAGTLGFAFDVPLVAFGFDVVDVESAMAENGRIDFFADADDVPDATVTFLDLVTPASGFYDPTIAYGDRTANRIDPITAESLGIPAFDRVVVTMGGSGGIDNLATTSLPEPATGLLVGLGLAIAGARRRH